MHEQDIHVHHSLLQTCKSTAVCQLHRVSSCNPASESKLLKAGTPDLAPNETLMLFKKKRLQSICRCSVVNASVSLNRAKLRALQMPQRKASLSNQKQCLCRNWAQWKARAALINRLAPACVTQQEPGSFYNLPLSRQHRWIVSLLQPIKSQTLSKARTQQSPQHRGVC